MVSPNKEHKLEIPEGCGYHLSVVSLPRGANGKTTVYVSVDGKSYVLATLDSQQNILQVPTDLIFNYQQAVTFFSKGSATVHCVGYRQALDLDDDEDTPFAVQSDDSDAERAARDVKLPVDAIENAAAAEENEQDEQDEEDEEEDEAEEEEGSVDHEGMAAMAAESEEESEGEEEDEEAGDSDIAEEPAGMRATHADPTAPSDEEDEEGEEDEEDEEDEEGEDEEEEEEEEEPPMKTARAETTPNKGSPQRRPSDGSPQRRPSGGSPQGRRSS